MTIETTTMSPRAERDRTTTAGTRVPSVLAVVVTHDGRAWIRESLVALANQTYPELDVLVIDDASPHPRENPRLRRIAKRHLRRRRWGYVRTPRPLGYGGAINWALSRVRSDADYLLFIHDDAALSIESVEHMVERLRSDERVAVVGPKVVLWNDPQILEEVGMAVDRFGYPYKGLEEGEIDLGQHDRPSEVFFVTSTCMLVRHDVFKRLRGWDARLGAFSEDLDLCWRARLLGFTVRLEPGATARHAIAMATGQRRTRFSHTRYFIRRNRLRVVAKNVATSRLLLLFPQFFMLMFAEMLGFLVLRQPREVAHLARALGWNLIRLPQTLSERARVQRERSVPDKVLSRFTVRETARVRVYVAHQAERLEQAWGRRAEIVSERATRARLASHSVRVWQAVITAVLFVGLLLGFRNFLWAPPAALGELLPFPERSTDLFRAWASPWQDTGLGHPGPASPVFFVFGLVQLITLGAASAAQKLLIGLLGVVAFHGASRLVSELVDRPARLVAGAVYAFGAVGYAGMRTGSLGALLFGSMAPFVLHSLLRFTGWTRPPRWSANREGARLAVTAALSAALVPGSLFLYLIAAVILTVTRAVIGRPSTEVKALTGSIAGLVLGWALLLPWSATWFSDGGPLSTLGGERSAEFAASFEGHGAASVLLGQTPDVAPLFGLALPLLGVVAVMIAEGQRRRVALALWALIACMALVMTAVANGMIKPIVSSPIELGVLAALAFAALSGLAVGAFRLDLPRRRLGVVHFLAVAGLAICAFLLAGGVLPTFVAAGWSPSGETGLQDPEAVEQIDALLAAEASGGEEFRTLWVGSGWGGPFPTAARPFDDYLLTDESGLLLTDLFARADSDGGRALRRVIAAVEAGESDQAGRLLSTFNIRFVVLDPGSQVEPWLAQRDLGVFRNEGDMQILSFDRPLARAAVYNELPPYVASLEEAGPGPRAEIERASASGNSAARHVVPEVHGPGVAFLAESEDPEWMASIDGGEALERIDGGWGNAFALQASGRGRLKITFPLSRSDVAWLVAMPLLWAFMVGAAFPSRSGQRTHVRTSRRAPARGRRPR